MRRSFSILTMVAAWSAAAAVSCSGGGDDDEGEITVSEDGAKSPAGGSGSGGTVLGSGGTVLGSGGMAFGSGGSGNASSSAGAGAGDACAVANASTTLAPVRLAILFDASGSMGELDYEWHDPVLKWDPVVSATSAFCSDSASAGIQASLTFFPNGGYDERCNVGQYATPDVPLTDLPSEAFASAISQVAPDRGGTPTLAVLSATISNLQALAEAEPEANYAILLVSDGHPQGCGDDDSLTSVAAAVSAVSTFIPTYVIGVRNPPIAGAPDNVSNLHEIAAAGGTDTAFLIDTGNPEQTTSDFLAAIDGIRGESLTCELAIPEPPEGRELDPQRVNVTHSSGATNTRLTYDATCLQASSWRYDDPDDPVQIELCPDTCLAVQADPDAELDVEFACEIVIPTLY